MLRRIWSRYALAISTLIAGNAPAAINQAAPNASTERYQIVAPAMCCQGCAKKIAAQLYTAPGVMNVKADVAKRTITITAKPSPKLTLERLWQAVEQGKGKPSQLITSRSVYTLTKPEIGKTVGQPDGVLRVVITGLNERNQADLIAAQLRSIRGIESLSVDLPQSALLVTPAAGVQLSPWALAAAVELTQETAVSITGPHGQLAIVPLKNEAGRAALSSRPHAHGAIQ